MLIYRTGSAGNICVSKEPNILLLVTLPLPKIPFSAKPDANNPAPN